MCPLVQGVYVPGPVPAPHHHHSHPVPRLLRVVPVTGTVFTLDVRHPLPAGGVIEQVIRWWRRVDETFSPFRPGSQVSRLNAGTLRRRDRAGELAQVLALCQQASAATGGYFDAYASGTLDPSGLVKGWSVETASAMLAAAGSPNHCINGGGDIQCHGERAPGDPWRLGIADPLRPGLLACVVVAPPGGCAIATSGTAERGVHIIDPVAGRPAAGLASITITGPRLALADAYATAAFAMGPAARDWVESLDRYEAFAVTPAGDVWRTSGFGEPTRGARRWPPGRRPPGVERC